MTEPQTIEEEIKKLEALVNGFTVILVEVNDHLAILRTIVRYMLLQATVDEVDQTEEGNPWKKLLKDYTALMNPHIKSLNAMLGIKVPDAAPPKSIVVAKQ